MDTLSGDREERLAEGIRLREDGRLDEARERLLDLSAEYPEDGVIAYQTAWVHDRLGLETAAVAYYRLALTSGHLSDDEYRGAATGCGSTLRTIGRYAESAELLEAALARFPDDGALRAFLAMALYNLGRHHESTALLLRTLAETSASPSVVRYRPAIEHYAQDLDAVDEA